MRPVALRDMSWRMAEVYGAITDKILVNLAKYFPYIQDADEAKGSFQYQARMLAQLGKVRKETVDLIAQNLKGADEALKLSLRFAIEDSLKQTEPALQKAAQNGLLGLETAPELNVGQMQAFRTYYRQSADKLNLVNTVMLESTEQAYVETVSDISARISRTQGILNTATGEVITGVSSWNSAVHDAVQRMAKNGLTGFIDHGGHQWSPETYVAMDVRTTLFNTARAAVWERMEQYGSDLYQVSSHWGARPLCYPWQLKVISRDGPHSWTTDFNGNRIEVWAQSETTYGEPAGLFGINCGHYPTVWIPGVSTVRGSIQSPEENEKTYALTQQQRQLERKLRAEKRDLAILRVQNADEETIQAQKARVQRASDEIANFCDENGLTRRRNREYTPNISIWDVLTDDQRQVANEEIR